MPWTSICSASSLEPRSGAKPPSSPTAVPRPASCRVFFSAWKTSAPIRRHSRERRRAGGDDHELLEVDLVVGVRAAVEHVHHRHRQDAGVRAAEVAPQRHAGVGRRGVRRGQRDAEDRVGAQARLVRGAVELDQRAVEPGLVGGVAADDGLGDLAVDVARRPCVTPLPTVGRRRRRAARWPRTRPSRRPRARPRGRVAPELSATSTSTVGLPRLSRIWRAWTL